MTKEQAKEWIKKFLLDVDSQDCRGTAKPILFLLQTKQEYVAHPEYNFRTETVFRHPEMDGRPVKTFDEAKLWLSKFGYEGERLAEEIENIEKFEMGHYWETTQAFFTKNGLNRHLELNGHNLRNHRDFVVHCFRNPEMKELFEALRVLVDEKYDGLSNDQ